MPYFSTTSAWASSGALTANSLVLGGGATGPKVSAGLITNGTAALTLGAVGTGTGNLNYVGNTSGTITVAPQAAAGTYNWNLPTTAGTAGQVLTSQAGASNAMTWTTPTVGTVTSVTQGSGITITPGGTITAGGTVTNSGVLRIDAQFADDIDGEHHHGRAVEQPHRYDTGRNLRFGSGAARRNGAQ
jgi:hypothetical protein